MSNPAIRSQPSGARGRRGRPHVARAWVAVGLCLAGLFFLGCASGPPRSGVVEESHGVSVQQSSLDLAPGQETFVFYPKRYQGPPNLEVKSTGNICQVLEQKDNGFRVKNISTASPGSLTWKA